VVIGRQPSPETTFDQMKKELAGLLGRHGVLSKVWRQDPPSGSR
jgi:hypothetical protein